MSDTWANTSLLRFRRERAVASFPELANCGHELFAFMGVYADRLPWSAYDKHAQKQYLAFLKKLHAERPQFLPDFLRDEHGTIEITFRTLETIKIGAIRHQRRRRSDVRHFDDRMWNRAVGGRWPRAAAGRRRGGPGGGQRRQV